MFWNKRPKSLLFRVCPGTWSYRSENGNVIAESSCWEVQQYRMGYKNMYWSTLGKFKTLKEASEALKIMQMQGL